MSLPESQQQTETVVFRVRRHGRRLTFPIIVLFAVAGAAGYFAGALPEQWMNLLAGAGAIVIGLVLGVLPILRWLATRTTVTTRRVIVRQGFVVQRRSELQLGSVREVRLKRGPLQRAFRSGDVELLVGAETPTRLIDVPGAELVVDALQELIAHNYVRGLPVQPWGGATQPTWVNPA